jgi:hypothetical protein
MASLLTAFEANADEAVINPKQTKVKLTIFSEERFVWVLGRIDNFLPDIHRLSRLVCVGSDLMVGVRDAARADVTKMLTDTELKSFIFSFC